MCTLYLDRQGARLAKQGGRFLVETQGEQKQSLPLEQVDRVLVYGRVQVTTDALAALLDRGIPTTFLTSHGHIHGHLLADEGGQIRRRARQYALIQEETLALPVAKAWVEAKLRNQRWLLRTLDQLKAAARLDAIIVSVQETGTLQGLRGLEGAGARLYFSAFPALLAETPFSFTGRYKHPATDPVNGLLSLGYTLLLAEVRNATHGYGLDPFAGTLHTSDGSQPSCALDVMEPLRPLVDRLVIRLARHDFTPEDFITQENGACFLRDGRRGVFYKAWEALLTSRILWKSQHQTYRAIIHAQVGALAHHLDDATQPLQPLSLSALGR